jgi:hypothetical protein
MKPIFSAVVAVIAALFGLHVRAEDKKISYVPKAGEFPVAGAGVYLCGELVEVDHINRRGALRLNGDGVDDRYHSAPSHRFALLPYGTIRFRGAPAELRDIPIGTVLHGYFTVPREGDTTIPAPAKGSEKYVPAENQALILEDDFSFYQRQGCAWKITAIAAEKGGWTTNNRVEKRLTATLMGPQGKDGLSGEQSFDFDSSTRVWKGRALGTLADLAPGLSVQVGLTWCYDWRYGRFHCAEGRWQRSGHPHALRWLGSKPLRRRSRPSQIRWRSNRRRRMEPSHLVARARRERWCRSRREGRFQ